MKKILSLSTVTFMVFSLLCGCSGDNEDDITAFSVTPKEISLTGREASARLTASASNVQWTSENEWVARVNNAGEVTSRHIGKTKIKAISGGHVIECKCTVSPRFETYEEPWLAFGKSKEEIIRKMGSPNYQIPNRDETSIVYGEKNDYQITSYTFENNKLSRVIVLLKSTDLRVMQIPDFLYERYVLILELTTGTETAFTNSYRLKDSSVMVIFNTKPYAGHYTIAYAPMSH